MIRSGRMTVAQEKALQRDLSRYRLSLFDGQVPSWQKVFGRVAPVVLEIGFGMGDSLLQMALNEPDKDFVGIEVHAPGAGRLIKQAVVSDISNLRVYLADAVDVLEDCIPDASISRAQIYFPDPWHKKKHHKRRLIQRPLVNTLCQKLVPHGLVHLATDWQAYAEHMVALLDAVDGLERSVEGSIYSERPAFRPQTKFERRGVQLGHGVWDILYRRTA